MSQEIIILYLKTAEFLKNKFVLDFSQTEKDYYITSMNCNLIIHDDYELVSEEMKQLSKKVIYHLKKVQIVFLKL